MGVSPKNAKSHDGSGKPVRPLLDIAIPKSEMRQGNSKSKGVAADENLLIQDEQVVQAAFDTDLVAKPESLAFGLEYEVDLNEDPK